MCDAQVHKCVLEFVLGMCVYYHALKTQSSTLLWCHHVDLFRGIEGTLGTTSSNWLKTWLGRFGHLWLCPLWPSHQNFNCTNGKMEATRWVLMWATTILLAFYAAFPQNYHFRFNNCHFSFIYDETVVTATNTPALPSSTEELLCSCSSTSTYVLCIVLRLCVCDYIQSFPTS